jgi:hypothetical protein
MKKVSREQLSTEQNLGESVTTNVGSGPFKGKALSVCALMMDGGDTTSGDFLVTARVLLLKQPARRSQHAFRSCSYVRVGCVTNCCGIIADLP